MLKYLALLLLIVVLSGAVFVRFRPLDPSVLHADPTTVEAPDVGHVLLRDDTAPVVALGKAELAQKLETVILATPRTTLLAGDLAGEHASYMTRTALWAFPDVASVKLIEVDGGTQIVVLSRQVYGKVDFGVNADRVNGWLAALD